jgi:hypothetical protein
MSTVYDLYTFIERVVPAVGAPHASTILTVLAVVAVGRGGRPGSAVDMLESHTERYHHAGAFGKPARSTAPKEELACISSGMLVWCVELYAYTGL